ADGPRQSLVHPVLKYLRYDEVTTALGAVGRALEVRDALIERPVTEDHRPPPTPSSADVRPEAVVPETPTPDAGWFLPPRYVARRVPRYFEDEDSEGRTYQPHVYPL